jgi:hypothetical protein
MKKSLLVSLLRLTLGLAVSIPLFGCATAIQAAQEGQATPETDQLSNPDVTSMPKEEVPPLAEGQSTLPGESNSQNTEGETPPMTEENVTWLVYQDSNFGFTLNYPSVFVIMPPASPKGDPLPVAEVIFQHKDVAGSDVAALAPPAFSIRIFDNPESGTASEWLSKHGRLSAGAASQLEEYVVDGVKGVRYCAEADIVPNCTIYAAHDRYLYAFVPGGNYTEEMLSSFRFGS